MCGTELILYSVCAEPHLAYIQNKLNSLEKRFRIIWGERPEFEFILECGEIRLAYAQFKLTLV
jgi:hypothetical protein